MSPRFPCTFVRPTLTSLAAAAALLGSAGAHAWSVETLSAVSTTSISIDGGPARDKSSTLAPGWLGDVDRTAFSQVNVSVSASAANDFRASASGIGLFDASASYTLVQRFLNDSDTARSGRFDFSLPYSMLALTTLPEGAGAHQFARSSASFEILVGDQMVWNASAKITRGSNNEITTSLTGDESLFGVGSDRITFEGRRGIDLGLVEARQFIDITYRMQVAAAADSLVELPPVVEEFEIRPEMGPMYMVHGELVPLGGVREMALDPMTQQQLMPGRYQIEKATVGRAGALGGAADPTGIDGDGPVRFLGSQRFLASGPLPVSTGPVPAVPEPGTWALMLVGLGAAAVIARRRAAAR